MPPAAQGQQIALLPDAAFQGVVLQALEGVTSAEACAEQCRAALPDCSFFTFCKSVSGMAAAGTRCRAMWPFAGPLPPDPPPGHARFHAHVCAVLVCAGHLQHPGLWPAGAGRVPAAESQLLAAGAAGGGARDRVRCGQLLEWARAAMPPVVRNMIARISPGRLPSCFHELQASLFTTSRAQLRKHSRLFWHRPS